MGTCCLNGTTQRYTIATMTYAMLDGATRPDTPPCSPTTLTPHMNWIHSPYCPAFHCVHVSASPAQPASPTCATHGHFRHPHLDAQPCTTCGILTRNEQWLAVDRSCHRTALAHHELGATVRNLGPIFEPGIRHPFFDQKLGARIVSV